MNFSTLKQTITSLTLVFLLSAGSAFAAPQYNFDSVNKAFMGLLKIDNPVMAKELEVFNEELADIFENVTNENVIMPYPQRVENLEQKLKEFYLLFIAPLEKDPAIVSNPTKKKILDAAKKIQQDFLDRVAVFNKGKISACHGSITVSFPIATLIATALTTMGYEHLIPAAHKKRAVSHKSMLTKLQKCLQIQR